MSFSRTGIAKDAIYYKRLDCDVNMEELCQESVTGTNVVNLISTYQGTDMERIYFSMGRQLDVWEYSA